ncbi:MAG: hypothetical protein F6J99_26505 [Moorea sp. SIO4G3]|nr:hypothetical protein [Moorena sp. SIO4G3]
MKALREVKGVKTFPRLGFKPSSHPKEHFEMDTSGRKARVFPNRDVSELEGKT